jgi:H+-transporting ATPase
VTAIFGVDILATIFCLFGWFTDENMVTDPVDLFVETKNGWTDIVTVVRIWGYSLGVEIVIALVYFLLNKISWLDDLGRAKRSKGDIKIENVLGHLARLTVEYEEPGKPKGRFFLSTSKEEEDVE